MTKVNKSIVKIANVKYNYYSSIVGEACLHKLTKQKIGGYNEKRL